MAAALPVTADPGAATPDGRWRLVAVGPALVLHDAAGAEARRYPAQPLGGGAASAVAEVVHAAARRSFVVVFATLPELWEISLDPQAEPIFNGYVHDYKMGEGIAEPGFLGVRRTKLDQPLRPPLAVHAAGGFVVGRATPSDPGSTRLMLVQLDVRRTIGRFDLAGQPDPGRAQVQVVDNRPLMRLPDAQGGPEVVVDLRAARVVAPPGR
jgi:hypothetical protein